MPLTSDVRGATGRDGRNAPNRAETLLEGGQGQGHKGKVGRLTSKGGTSNQTHKPPTV